MIELNFRFAVPSHGVQLDGHRGAFRLLPRQPPKEEGRFYYARSKVLDITDFPALFLDFAALKKTAKAVEMFANEFGTIGLASQDTLKYPAPVHHFIKENLTWKTDEFSEVKKWFPEIDKMKEAVGAWRGGEFPAPLDDHYVTLLARGTVCHRCSEDSAVRLIFIPDGLLDALWVQFFSAMARKAQFRQCEWKACGRWFEVGPGSGKRSHARFCREKCRNDFHNSQRE